MAKRAAYVNPKYSITFKAELPFLLRWAERFIRFDIEKKKIKQDLRGHKISIVYIDEIA